MTTDEQSGSRAKRAQAAQTSGFARKHDEEPPKTATAKVEKNVRRRVLKLGKMARHHASEACEPENVAREEPEITREVIEGTERAPQDPVTGPLPPVKKPNTFVCCQCGAEVPVGSDKCPGCDSLIVNDVSDEQLRDLENAEREVREETLSDVGRMLGRTETPCVHFDAEEGTVSYLQDDNDIPNVSAVCSNCDTEVEIDVDLCPICGAKLEKHESGLVGLIDGTEFDKDDSPEMECPFCGEHVLLEEGRCPACKEMVHPADDSGPSERVESVIHMDNVVFLHLDVSTGEVNYLQRLARNRGYEQLTVKLDEIGRGGFEKDWKSLSRV